MLANLQTNNKILWLQELIQEGDYQILQMICFAEIFLKDF